MVNSNAAFMRSWIGITLMVKLRKLRPWNVIEVKESWNRLRWANHNWEQPVAPNYPTATNALKKIECWHFLFFPLILNLRRGVAECCYCSFVRKPNRGIQEMVLYSLPLLRQCSFDTPRGGFHPSPIRSTSFYNSSSKLKWYFSSLSVKRP